MPSPPIPILTATPALWELGPPDDSRSTKSPIVPPELLLSSCIMQPAAPAPGSYLYASIVTSSIYSYILPDDQDLETLSSGAAHQILPSACANRLYTPPL